MLQRWPLFKAQGFVQVAKLRVFEHINDTNSETLVFSTNFLRLDGSLLVLCFISTIHHQCVHASDTDKHQDLRRLSAVLVLQHLVDYASPLLQDQFEQILDALFLVLGDSRVRQPRSRLHQTDKTTTATTPSCYSYEFQRLSSFAFVL
jgi:hypothetical protein